jgi:diguanylate cyclase (GGDEF)-like protein
MDTSEQTTRVLVVDGDGDRGPRVAALCAGLFGAGGTLLARSVGEARAARAGEADLVVCGSRFDDGTTLDALSALAALESGAPVIVCLSPGEESIGELAMERGVTDVFVFDRARTDVLSILLTKSAEVARAQRDNLRLQAALATTLAEVRRKNRELEQQAADLAVLAATDPLTSLANRWRLHDRLQPTFAEAARYGADLACLMIDLDDFKRVNDSRGHQTGDEVLAMLGRIINAQVRASDIAARLGGDEFVVVMPHTSAATAVALAERLMVLFHRHAAEIAGPGSRCGMSVGIACLSVSGPADSRQLLAHADNALYGAKRAGKGAVMICGPDGVTSQPAALFAA